MFFFFKTNWNQYIWYLPSFTNSFWSPTKCIISCLCCPTIPSIAFSSSLYVISDSIFSSYWIVAFTNFLALQNKVKTCFRMHESIMEEMNFKSHLLVVIDAINIYRVFTNFGSDEQFVFHILFIFWNGKNLIFFIFFLKNKVNNFKAH